MHRPQDIRLLMTRLSLITGASRGLGFATAKALSGPDEHIIAVARTVGGLEELDDAVQANGGSATLVPLDITDETGLQNLGKSIFDRWGQLDLFIHCAAVPAPLAPVGHIDAKDLDRVWAVNARGTQRLITMLDPLLKTATGTAVHCHDTHLDAKFGSAYRASKSAALNFVESWKDEAADIGPTVKVFEPGPMPTALRARFHPGEDRSNLSTPEIEAAKLLALI